MVKAFPFVLPSISPWPPDTLRQLSLVGGKSRFNAPAFLQNWAKSKECQALGTPYSTILDCSALTVRGRGQDNSLRRLHLVNARIFLVTIVTFGQLNQATIRFEGGRFVRFRHR